MAFSTDKNREDYSGNGTTTVFPLRFPWQLDADIAVIITNTLVSPPVSYDLVLDLDYTLSGAGESSGSLTFPKVGSVYPTLPAGWTITARRVPELTQESDFQDGDGMPSDVVEAAIDRAMMACGALQEQANRAITLPESYAGVSVQAPLPVAGCALIWNPTADGLVNGPSADQIIQAQGAAIAAVAAKDAAEAAQSGAESAADEAVAAAATVPNNAESRLEALESNTLDKSLFTAAWDFIVGSGAAAAVKKTIDEVASAIQAKLLALVGAYTRQQYAVPVAHATTTGNIALDADLHQDVSINATGNITLSAPTNPVAGKYIFLTLYAASALTITWNSVFKGNADYTTLDSVFVAGKRIFLQFRCIDGTNWVLMGRAQEA